MIARIGFFCRQSFNGDVVCSHQNWKPQTPSSDPVAECLIPSESVIDVMGSLGIYILNSLLQGKRQKMITLPLSLSLSCFTKSHTANTGFRIKNN